MSRSFANAIGVFLCVLLLPAVPPARGAAPPPLSTPGGVVAADHRAASEVGAAVLARGGNAVDAAIATALALGVVNPMSSGIGGGGFAVVWDAHKKKLRVFDFREIAPAALSPESFVVDGKLDPQLSKLGGLAVGVPGEVAGLARLSRELGKLPWSEVVAPAQRLAARGFRVSWFLARAAAILLERRTTPEVVRAFLTPGGEPLRRGRWVKRSKLAATLARIAAEGRDGFYRGPVADDIIRAVRASGGVMTREDLAGYRVREPAPLVGDFGRYRLATMPLPSSGGLALLEALGILDAGGFDLKKSGVGSSATLHRLAEVLKHAFADRARFLGDTKGARAVAETLLAPARLARLAGRIGEHTLAHDRYGDRGLGAASPPVDDHGTSHLCVIDGDGNAVALTTTVNTYLGSKVITPKSGVVLNNEIDDFSLRAGVANAYGLVQSDANLVGPGKRPLSSMTPVLVFDGDRVVGCLGGSGGPRIISGTFEVLLDVFVFGMDVSEAVAAARIHHQWTPDVLWVETHTAADVIAGLERRGHQVKVGPALTAVQAIVVDDEGIRHAASDPRKGGAPAAAPRRVGRSTAAP